MPGAQQWVNDLPNDANKKFVADYITKYKTRPSFYGAQSYDAANLINSAVVAVKGDLSKKDAMRDEMRKVNYKSVRGPYKYGNNHVPIQNFYLQEPVKNDKGEIEHWTCETSAPSALRRAGWSQDTIRTGETLTLDGVPARDGSRLMRITGVTRADGTKIGTTGRSDD